MANSSHVPARARTPPASAGRSGVRAATPNVATSTATSGVSEPAGGETTFQTAKAALTAATVANGRSVLQASGAVTASMKTAASGFEPCSSGTQKAHTSTCPAAASPSAMRASRRGIAAQP